MEIILASQSPRRRELLSEAGFEFRTFPVKVSENIDENLTPEVQVVELARRKAHACLVEHNLSKSKGIIVLGADTLVFLRGKSLGKPRDFSEAAQFLRLLSGQMHSVMTGISLICPETGVEWSGFSETKVEFRNLSDEEIAAYVSTGEPMDKAGGYGIQGAAQKFVSSKEGSWSNVVGLPLELLEQALKARGWNVRRTKSKPSS